MPKRWRAPEEVRVSRAETSPRGAPLPGRVTAPSSPEHARRRYTAYSHAAATHERAAVSHQDAADLFDKHAKPGLADRERRMADAERLAAVADRDRALRSSGFAQESTDPVA